jgi:hypothetical protein
MIALSGQRGTRPVMSEQPSPEERAAWQRRLASQANNRAWTLAEALSRTPDEDDELLEAANAAMFFWNLVGAGTHRANAAQLLAHAYALRGFGDAARRYFAKCEAVVFADDAAPWQHAMAHAIAANVAAAGGERDAHRSHYAEASRLVATLESEDDRNVVNATLRVIPAPAT